MTSGASATNSAAYLRMLSASLPPQRVSIRTLRPTIQPNCCNSCWNAARRACASGSATAAVMSTPMLPHTVGLLRTRGERPRCRAAEKRDEFSSLHARPETLEGYRSDSNRGFGRDRRCLLWVISGHMQCKKPCPLYPRKRTCAAQTVMSALGQQRTHAPQQTASRFLTRA